jgi:hypothetical protein
MSVCVSWFCYCDDCAERLDDGDQSNKTATEARRGVLRRKMRDGKLYDFCKECIEDRAHREDDSVPERPIR